MTHSTDIPQLKVLIAERSLVEWKRVFKLLEGIDSIEFIKVCHKGSCLPEMLTTMKPDVLVINIDTPERKGINLLKLAHSEHPNLLIVVLSSNSSHIYSRIYKAAGASYVFDKSTEFHSVVTLLGAISVSHQTKSITP